MILKPFVHLNGSPVNHNSISPLFGCVINAQIKSWGLGPLSIHCISTPRPISRILIYALNDSSVGNKIIPVLSAFDLLLSSSLKGTSCSCLCPRVTWGFSPRPTFTLWIGRFIAPWRSWRSTEIWTLLFNEKEVTICLDTFYSIP